MIFQLYPLKLIRAPVRPPQGSMKSYSRSPTEIFILYERVNLAIRRRD